MFCKNLIIRSGIVFLVAVAVGCAPPSPEEQARRDAEHEQHQKKLKAEIAALEAEEKKREAAFKQEEVEHRKRMAAIEASGGAAGVGGNGDKHAAYAMAQDFVTSQLRYPDGDFPWTATQVKDQGDGVWFVHCYVDAKNSFNATVRTYFNANLKHLGGDRWTLETLDVWEQGQPLRKVK